MLHICCCRLNFSFPKTHRIVFLIPLVAPRLGYPILACFSPLPFSRVHTDNGMALDNLALKAIGIVLGLVVVRLTIAYFCSPLKAIPGPFVAKFTDLWRFYDYWCCTHTHSHQALHKKHGPAVRIGPNMVSLSDPDLLKQVYSTRGDFVKVLFFSIHPYFT